MPTTNILFLSPSPEVPPLDREPRFFTADGHEIAGVTEWSWVFDSLRLKWRLTLVIGDAELVRISEEPPRT